MGCFGFKQSSAYVIVGNHDRKPTKQQTRDDTMITLSKRVDLTKHISPTKRTATPDHLTPILERSMRANNLLALQVELRYQFNTVRVSITDIDARKPIIQVLHFADIDLAIEQARYRCSNPYVLIEWISCLGKNGISVDVFDGDAALPMFSVHTFESE